VPHGITTEVDVSNDVVKDFAKLDKLIAQLKGKPARVIYDGTEYGVWQEFGAKPHVIRPNKAKALSWPGAEHPVGAVHHPGNPPHPFMRPAIEHIRPALKDGWQAVLDGTITADDFVEKLATDAEAIARSMAPYDTGNLSNAIGHCRPEEFR